MLKNKTFHQNLRRLITYPSPPQHKICSHLEPFLYVSILKSLQIQVHLSYLSLSSAWHIECAQSPSDKFFNRYTQAPLLVITDGAVSSVRHSCLVQSDKKIEAKTCVSSPPRNSLSTAAAITETTWDYCFKNRKDPEQRIYKKPNLVVKPLQLVSKI